MGRRILLFALAILMILSAEVFLAGRASRAADDCITKPGAAPPQGSHWYYRLDHANNRQCWYLAAEGAKVRPHARQAASSVRSQSPNPSARPQTSTDDGAYGSTPAEAVPAEATSVEMTVGQVGTDENDSMTTSSRQWSSLPASAVSNDRALVSTTHGSADQSNKTPLLSPVFPPSEPLVVEPRPNSATSAAPLSAVFVAVLGFAAMIVGVAFALFTLRKRSPSRTRSRLACTSSPHRRAKQAFSTFANVAASAGQTEMPRKRAKTPPAPSTPVVDIEASVRRLLQELQRREHEPRWQDFDRTLGNLTA